MKTLDMKAWAEAARSGKRRLAIPIMTHPGIELCGCTVRDAVTDGEVHARAILALNDRYPADACSVIMDLTVEAEAFAALTTGRRSRRWRSRRSRPAASRSTSRPTAS